MSLPRRQWLLQATGAVAALGLGGCHRASPTWDPASGLPDHIEGQWLGPSMERAHAWRDGQLGAADNAASSAQGDGLLKLPVGSALIKSFKMGERLIETRVLLHREAGWVALPYQWNAEQTEARLVVAGVRLDLTTPAGQAISYSIPNKNQCKECHALSGAVTPIGPKAYNLDIRWLADWRSAGQLDAVPVVDRRIPLWELRDVARVEPAARGYLDVNCAHCHNPAGSASNSGLDLRWEQTDLIKFGIGKRPVAAGRGSGGLDFDIKPGDPAHSILYYRMASLEGGISMPEVGRSSLDPEGMAVVARWIRGMKQ